MAAVRSFVRLRPIFSASSLVRTDAVRWSYQKTVAYGGSWQCGVCPEHRRVVFYSSQRRSGGDGSGRGLVGRFLDNLRKDLETNKELEASLRGLQDETTKIERSEWLQSLKNGTARLKARVYHSTSVGVAGARRGWSRAAEATMSLLGRASSTELGKKTQNVASQVSQTANTTARKVSEHGEQLGQTQTYQKVAEWKMINPWSPYGANEGMKVVKEEFLEDIIEHSKPYTPPSEILKRTDPARTSSFSSQAAQKQERVIEPNEEETRVVQTRQSKLHSWWSNLRENNPITNLLYTMRMKYDESDNVVVRASRAVTDRVGDTFGGMVTQSDMAEAMAEIRKVDPYFSKETFVKECEFDIIPTVLEAFLQGKLEVLKDWCHTPAYNMLAAQIEQNSSFGRRMDCKVLDVRDVDIAMAKVLEQGPVLILTFSAQQLMIVRDAKGEIVEGGEDNIENVVYVWALCRDQTIYDRKMAWRVIEFAIQHTGKLLV